MDNKKEEQLADGAQLKKYAEDLAAVYLSEKEKREELQRANAQLKIYADDLNRTLEELNDAYLDTINRLVKAAEYKDEDTGDHILRMSRYSGLLAKLYGLPEKEIQNIQLAAPMHDIGKVGIPESILLKPGKLTDAEFETMRSHCSIGAKILANSKSDVLMLGQQIAISHHEKWNGSGYPLKISGDKIHFAGRIVALADVFDALSSKRPYKDPYPMEVVLDIIKKEKGEHFDPVLVDLFLAHIDEFLMIAKTIKTEEAISSESFSFSERDREDAQE